MWLKRGDLAQAATHLALAEPGPAVYEGLIRVYLGQGELALAEGVLEKAAKLDKPSQALAETIALCRRVAKRRDELGAMARNTERQNTWLLLGSLACVEVLREDGRPATPEEQELLAASRMVEIGPLAAWSARQALQRGKLTLALSEAEKAITLSKSCAGGYYVRGRVRLERGAEERWPI